MRILWLSHLIPYPPKGGILQRAHYLLREVAKHHEVDLLAFNQPDLMRPLFPSLDEGLKEARHVLETFCRNVEFFPISSDKHQFGNYLLALKSLYTTDPYNINWLKSHGFSNKLVEYLSMNSYDLVHFDTISLVPYLKYINSIPAVLDHHNIESHMLLRRARNEKNVLKKWYFHQEGVRLQRVEQEVCPRFNLNITCSEIDRDRLKGIAPGSKVEEVPNGVDTGYFKKNVSVRQEKSLIFVGTLSWYPNAEAVRFIANELWPTLRNEMPGVCFDIVGANPPQDIKDLAEKDSKFRVHGFVDDVRPYLDKAAIFICPIKDGGGTKLKILDAFSMEKAVIAHPVACEGIHVRDGEHVLFAKTISGYIEKIKRLISDDEYRKKLGASARHLVEQQYSYDTIGRELSCLYQECLPTIPSAQN